MSNRCFGSVAAVMAEDVPVTPPRKNGGNALDKAWTQQGSTTKANKPKTEKDIAEAVRKALSDACKWASPEEIDGSLYEGLTLRQRLEKDKRAAYEGDKGKVFGKTYYLQLRQWYGAKTTVQKELKMSEDHKVNPALFKAVAQMLRQPPNRSYICAFASSCVSLQRNDVVAMSRALLELCPKASADQLHTAVEILKGLARAGSWGRDSQRDGIQD